MQFCRTYKSYILLTLTFLFADQIMAQTQGHEAPLPIELLTGNNNLYFQMVVKKSFTPESKFGFFSVATYTVAWEDFNDVSITLPVQINYSVGKGFGVLAGGRINNMVGFDPMAGMQHNYASKQILTVTVASVFLNDNHDAEIFGLYEYRPPISQQWALYTRLQLLYVYGLENGQHNRSYLYLRAGVKRGPFSFGVGANLDSYGEDHAFKDNYGPFVIWDLK